MRIAVGLGKENVEARLERQGVSRRDFLKFCSMVAVTMGMGTGFAEQVARALTMPRRPSVVYLHNAECTGCSEALLRTGQPFIDELILDTISLDYHETIMAAAGEAAEAALEQAISAPEGFICVVEGAIPTANEGKYGYIAGHTMLDICGRILPKAKAVVAYGDLRRVRRRAGGQAQPHRRDGRQRMLRREGHQGHQHRRLPPEPAESRGHAGRLPARRQHRARRQQPPHDVLRQQRARPVRAPGTLRQRRIRSLLRFRRGPQRLVFV